MSTAVPRWCSIGACAHKTVLTYGTYDLLHKGHVLLLERAKQLGDYLIVGLSTDAFNRVKNKNCVYPYEDRLLIVSAIRYVDKVIPEENWEQKVDDIKRYKVDVLVMGDDWQGQFDSLERVLRGRVSAQDTGYLYYRDQDRAGW